MGSWAPWVSGILIGLMVPAMYLIIGRGFGVSQSLQHLGAACLPKAKIDYFRLHDWRSHRWNLVFIGGIVIGSFLGHSSSPPTPSKSSPLRRIRAAASSASALVASWWALERATPADAHQATRSPASRTSICRALSHRHRFLRAEPLRPGA